ncbi:unnamed protein product [Rhizopus stolonifer]
MSSEIVLWNATEWFKTNYKETNGFPMFFIKGDYSYQNRDRAMNDYVTTVTLAKSSDDPLYAQWSSAVSEAEFIVIINPSFAISSF